jgi:hypothetical protein
VSAEWPGAVLDSRIWRNSHICRVLRDFNNVGLIGDKGYGIEKCLLTPYRNPATSEEIAYNNLFKGERVIIERCFGQVNSLFCKTPSDCHWISFHRYYPTSTRRHGNFAGVHTLLRILLSSNSAVLINIITGVSPPHYDFVVYYVLCQC